MVHLFIGYDAAAKDAKISEIRRKLFPDSGTEQFDYEVLHAHKLPPEDLKKALMALPAMASQRLVLIRNGAQLSAQNKTLLLDFCEARPKHCLVILDVSAADPKDRYWGQLRRFGRMETFGATETTSVFRLTDAIGSGRKTEALQILASLLNQGDHPLQILGALGWHWGRVKQRIPFDRFEKGLRDLQEADLNIKRSRLKPEHALEILVVRLCR